MNNGLGLTSAQAKQLLMKYGRNEIKIQTRFFEILASQFTNTFVLLLIGVAIISLLLSAHEDAIIIGIIVIIHASIGFYQEYKSNNIAVKLMKKISHYAMVYRDNKWVKIHTTELVPADYIKLEVGDKIPADVKILKAENFSIDESILTGESFPVVKKENDVAYASSFVTSGYAEAVVIATGNQTYIGKTASKLSKRQITGFEKSLAELSNSIMLLTILSSLLILILNIFIGKSIVETFLFSIVLAVGLIPEAFPIVVTFSLALSAQALSKHGLIIKKLSSIETLGNVDVICVDKTGTLTENTINVSKIVDLNGKENGQLSLFACLCIEDIKDILKGKQDKVMNVIDEAIYNFGVHNNIYKNRANYEPVKELQFDYVRRRMSVIIKNGNNKKLLLITKGAVESIINILADNNKNEIKDVATKFTEQGYRVIAIAYKEIENENATIDDERNMHFLGFILLTDPPKKTAKDYIKMAKTFGVSVKVISGDHANTVKYIANSVGIEINNNGILTGQDIEVLSKNWEEFKKKVEECSIFARVYPEQKQLIVKALKENGHVVCFLGDGINDVLALKEADVSLCVDSASDIAKDVSHIILMKKNLASIIQAIIGGRKTFFNIVKYLNSTFVGNFSNLFIVGLISPFIRFLPLKTSQVLLVNFLTDLPLLSIATDNVDDDELIKPQKWDVRGILLISAIFGLLATIFNLVLLFSISSQNEDVFRTMLFLYLLFSGIFVIFNLRTFKHFYESEMPSLRLILASIVCLALGIYAVYYMHSIFGFTQITEEQLMFILIITLIFFISTEIVKHYYFGLIKREVVKDQKALNIIRKKISKELH
ncbi:MAG: HAD-IC family P-type ATPase [Candidatus Anstonellales archaeon]